MKIKKLRSNRGRDLQKNLNDPVLIAEVNAAQGVFFTDGALLVDPSAATSDAKLSRLKLRNASLSDLDRGDRHNLKTGLTTPSPAELTRPKHRC